MGVEEAMYVRESGMGTGLESFRRRATPGTTYAPLAGERPAPWPPGVEEAKAGAVVMPRGLGGPEGEGEAAVLAPSTEEQEEERGRWPWA